jgi:DNA-directed RNA polymerase specialized sigma24 family protein
MKIPVGTVKTWLFRAREALRKKLEKSFRVRA